MRPITERRRRAGAPRRGGPPAGRRGQPERTSRKPGPATTVIGVVSDTHGLVRPEALRRLRRVDRIIHAGDIGSRDVLAALEPIAPVIAVRGNNDHGAWARAIPETALVEVGPVRLYVLHDLKTLAVDPRAAAIDVVIAGHSHRPSVIRQEGVCYLNPGSIGPRRFTLPVAMAILTVRASRVRARLVFLDVPGLERNARGRRG